MPTTTRTLIWFVGVLFVLFQLFLQLSSGVVIGSIMHEMQLSAFTAGLLSSMLYVIYTLLQIPVGLLFDRKSSRVLMTVTAMLCSLGCLLFASSHTLLGLFLGRSLIGAGSSFAFVGLSHLLRQYFPLRQFAFMIGLSETLGFTTTVIGMIGMGTFISHWGWRGFIQGAGVVGFFIAYLCWAVIPNHALVKKIPLAQAKKQLMTIFVNKAAWINGLFVGLSFTIVTAFGALWAVPFIQVKLHSDLKEASVVSALFFLGTAFSCPLFGFLSAQCKRRRPLILSSCLSTAGFLLLLLYLPTNNHTLVATLMFIIGLCCGAYMLAYSIANELAPAGSLSTCAGFTNMLAVLITPLLQPFIGYLIDRGHETDLYNLADYQRALLTIPLSLLLASVLAYFLPEKKWRCLEQSKN